MTATIPKPYEPYDVVTRDKSDFQQYRKNYTYIITSMLVVVLCFAFSPWVWPTVCAGVFFLGAMCMLIHAKFQNPQQALPPGYGLQVRADAPIQVSVPAETPAEQTLEIAPVQPDKPKIFRRDLTPKTSMPDPNEDGAVHYRSRVNPYEVFENLVRPVTFLVFTLILLVGCLVPRWSIATLVLLVVMLLASLTVERMPAWTSRMLNKLPYVNTEPKKKLQLSSTIWLGLTVVLAVAIIWVPWPYDVQACLAALTVAVYWTARVYAVWACKVYVITSLSFYELRKPPLIFGKESFRQIELIRIQTVKAERSQFERAAGLNSATLFVDTPADGDEWGHNIRYFMDIDKAKHWLKFRVVKSNPQAEEERRQREEEMKLQREQIEAIRENTEAVWQLLEAQGANKLT